MDPEGLEKTFDTVFGAISQARESFEPRPRPREMGVITSIATGVAKVSGLPGVGFEELVTFPGDILGIAFNVDEDELGVVLLGDYVRLRAGDQVERTGRVMDVAVATACWAASSTRSAGRSTAASRWPRTGASRLNVPPSRSWTGRR